MKSMLYAKGPCLSAWLSAESAGRPAPRSGAPARRWAKSIVASENKFNAVDQGPAPKHMALSRVRRKASPTQWHPCPAPGEIHWNF